GGGVGSHTRLGSRAAVGPTRRAELASVSWTRGSRTPGTRSPRRRADRPRSSSSTTRRCRRCSTSPGSPHTRASAPTLRSSATSWGARRAPPTSRRSPKRSDRPPEPPRPRASAPDVRASRVAGAALRASADLPLPRGRARHARRPRALPRPGLRRADRAHPLDRLAPRRPWPFYPFSGGPDDQGGTMLNVPLSAGSGDAEYAEAFERKVAPAVSAFEPELVLVSAGFDAHAEDPLAGMLVSAAGFRDLARRSAALAPKVAAVLEGGYNVSTLPNLVAAALEGFHGGG